VAPISQTGHVVLLGQDGRVQGQGCLQDLQPLLPNALVLEGINIKPESTLQQEETPMEHVSETAKVIRGNATDAAVFLYYFRSIGVLSLVAFLMLTMSFAFFSVFPSKHHLSIQRLESMLIDHSNMVTMVGRGRSQC